MSNWISVEDELPKKPKYYLVFTRCGAIWNTQLLFWNMGDVTHKWEDRDRNCHDNVTHWMQLPEPPEEDKQTRTRIPTEVTRVRNVVTGETIEIK